MTDLAPSYLEHRTRLAQASAADELLARYARPSSAKPAGAPAAPAASPIGAGTETDTTGSLVGRVAGDVGRGVVETPRALLKGVRDAVQETIDMAGEFGSWVEQAANLPGLKISDDGIEIVSAKELAQLDRPGTLPDLSEPKSVTGGAVKAVSQFLTGMAGAGKVLKAAGWAKGAASYGRTATAGAIANFTVFDPHQARLSNLIQEVPALANPVTEYLAADPTDNAAEGRFKSALEGLGFGVAADGMFKAVRTLRQVRLARAAAPAAEVAPADLPANAFRELGDDAAEAGSRLVRRKPFAAKPEPGVKPSTSGASPEDLAKAAKDGTEEGKLYINFARIDTADDIKRVMREMGERQRETIDAGRRGKQTFEQIKLNAEQQDAWEVLSARRVGEPLNAEQSLAARQLWVASSEKLTQLAQMAADAPSEANLFAFRKMLAVHDAVQQQVIAARTETARALASWRIPAGGGAERLRDVAAALEAAGGSEVARELASRVAALGRAGMHKEIAAVIEKTAYARTRDAVIEGWINGLLSSPKTHVVNMTSNSAVMFLRMAERRVAAGVREVLGDQGGVEAQEAAAQWHGLTSGIRDAFRFAAKAAKTGESGYGIGKMETAREGAITSEALKISSNGWLGRGVDLLGQLVRVPGRAMTAEDEFFKTLGYRMELHAQAVRTAADDVAAGRIPEAGYTQRITELVENPPENLRMAAVDAATYQTFTNAPGKIAQSLSHLTANYPGLKVILPFVRTPANILTFTFERTPLAPLMSKFRADIAAGGARQQLAIAQAGLGTTAMLAMADATLNGQVTGRGPVEKGERDALLRSGWKPYSLRVGDRWVTYNRLDPLGSLIGMSADVVETLQHAQHDSLDDPDTERLAVAASIAFAGNLVNKTYLSGVSSLVEALNDPSRSAERWAQRLAGSVVPAVVAQGARLEDPYVREVNSMVDAIRARTPGLSDNLPPRRDLWGRPISTASDFGPVFDAFAPVAAGGGEKEPIDQEIIAQGVNLTMPSRKTSFDGVAVDLGQHPAAYARYIELAGNELKHPAWGLGAKDLLNQIVTGKHPLSQIYQLRSDGPDGGKDVFIRDTVRQYREFARNQVLQEFPELRDEVSDKRERQRQLAMPVLAQ